MSKITIFDSLYEDFSLIDWNFPKPSLDLSASIHPYPARFINDIPKELIRLLKKDDGGIVLDPFCGSGTTMFEAQKAGIKSVGIDLNPIACLISKVRTSVIPSEFLQVADSLVSGAQKSVDKPLSIPEIPNLSHWFKPEIQVAIAALLQQINYLQDTAITDPLRLALSSIIVRVSNQESDTRYAAVNKNYCLEDVFTNFLSSCKKIAQICNNQGSADAEVICNDVLKVASSDIESSLSMVITSPPYPNAYEYWLYHKYRMWWLGYDPIQVREYEIGARPNYHKKNGQTAEDFVLQMSKVFDLFVPKLLLNGHVCFVIGRSIIRGKEIDNAQLITNVAEDHGLSLKVNIEREIAQTRKSFNLSYGKIKTENILVFRKE